MSDTTSEPARRSRAPRGRRGPSAPPAAAAPALPDRLAQRVIVEHVRPEIDGGRFPIKRTPGERVVVAAAIHADGHDAIAASLWYRTVEHHSAGAAAESSRPFDTTAGWQEVTMVPLGNDEWTAAFTVGSGPGGAEYTIEAWVDTFASWRKGLVAKVQAGQDVSSELLEGAALLRDAASRSPRADLLLDRATLLASDADARVRETAALDLARGRCRLRRGRSPARHDVRPGPTRAGGSRARPFRIVVRDVSPVRRYKPDAKRHVPRG